MSHELSHRHRNTIEEIFRTPTSENIGWHAVRTLLEKIGEVEQVHDGKMKVTVGSESEALQVPHGKQLDVEQVLDVRRMLAAAGFAPDA